MQLEKNNEIVGKLDSFGKYVNKIILKFTIKKEIRLSEDSISEDLLTSLQGKKIGLINIDGNYFIRIIGGSR